MKLCCVPAHLCTLSESEGWDPAGVTELGGPLVSPTAFTGQGFAKRPESPGRKLVSAWDQEQLCLLKAKSSKYCSQTAQVIGEPIQPRLFALSPVPPQTAQPDWVNTWRFSKRVGSPSESRKCFLCSCIMSPVWSHLILKVSTDWPAMPDGELAGKDPGGLRFPANLNKTHLFMSPGLAAEPRVSLALRDALCGRPQLSPKPAA